MPITHNRRPKTERLEDLSPENRRPKTETENRKPKTQDLLFMTIRPATRADVSQMLRLAENTATAARWTRAQYERLYETNAPRRVTLVSEQQSEVCGFITALAVGDEWEIENVIVAPDVRRHGLAKRLLETLLEQARTEGVRALFLEVRESNLAARSLYEKSGFDAAGRRPRYYSDPTEDAVLYRHRIA